MVIHRVITYLFFSAALFIVCTAKAQKLDNAAQVNAAVQSQIKTWCQSNGDLLLFAEKNDISGSMEVKLTLDHKGKVLTVNSLSDKNMSIPHKNALKDYLFRSKFKYKAQKKAKYTTTYTFNF